MLSPQTLTAGKITNEHENANYVQIKSPDKEVGTFLSDQQTQLEDTSLFGQCGNNCIDNADNVASSSKVSHQRSIHKVEQLCT